MIDIFDRTKALFEIPKGVIYLDGNSLGPLATVVRTWMASEIEPEAARS
jgi:kynureninase